MLRYKFFLYVNSGKRNLTCLERTPSPVKNSSVGLGLRRINLEHYLSFQHLCYESVLTLLLRC